KIIEPVVFQGMEAGIAGTSDVPLHVMEDIVVKIIRDFASREETLRMGIS
ncbi:hypothetical protein EVA_19567, partial [gut metagenome]